jgi:hypothetical protein
MLPTAMGAISLIEINRHDGSTDVELMGESEHSICVGCIRAKLYVRLLNRAKEEKHLKNGENAKAEKKPLEYQLRSAKISSDAKKQMLLLSFFRFFYFHPSFFLSFFSWYVLCICYLKYIQTQLFKQLLISNLLQFFIYITRRERELLLQPCFFSLSFKSKR